MEESFEESFQKFIAQKVKEEEEGIDPGRCEEARELLDAGIPIYYSNQEYPDDIIKEYPDGRREIVDLDENYRQFVVRKL
jgi:hypothetical protein